MNLTNEFQPIRDWAQARGILEKGDVKSQTLKTMEELGELAKAIIENKPDEIIDSIGDVVVTLVCVAEFASHNLSKDCNACHGDGYFYEDVVGDGGPQMRIPCDCQFTIEDCINAAFAEIKDRKGKMDNGTFVKDK